MRFGDERVGIGIVPGPVDLVRGNSLEIALLAMKSLILDKKPDLAFHDEIKLLRFMRVRLGVITGSPGRNHETALITVPFFHHHGALAGSAGLNPLSSRNILVLDMKWHRTPRFIGLRRTICRLRQSVNTN